MTETITRVMFASLARTAAMALTPDEAEHLRAEMNRQMEIIRRLESIRLDDSLTPAVHGNPYPEDIRAELRDDTPIPFENRGGIIDQVPHVKDGYIVSPDLKHKRLD